MVDWEVCCVLVVYKGEDVVGEDCVVVILEITKFDLKEWWLGRIL